MSARDLFAELMQGVEDMAAQREGAIMLCNASFGDIPAPELLNRKKAAVR